MIYAWVNGEKRPPLATEERTICRDCGGVLSGVMPVENAPHWRHEGGDCDPWNEGEGKWHLQWKDMFDLGCREVSLRDPETGELHRADVLVADSKPKPTVLELQHSTIEDKEQDAREAFYMKNHRMFWLVHIHNDPTFLAHSFGMSLDFQKRPADHKGKQFGIMAWMGPSTRFIEKWKASKAHVFFHYGSLVYYLANKGVAARLGSTSPKGEFALCRLTPSDFIRAVRGEHLGHREASRISEATDKQGTSRPLDVQSEHCDS